METTVAQPLLVDEHQACKFLDISVSVLRRDRAKAHLKIPLVRIGGSVRYRLDDLRKWVDGQVTPPEAPADTYSVQETATPPKRSPGRPTNASRKAQAINKSES